MAYASPFTKTTTQTSSTQPVVQTGTSGGYVSPFSSPTRTQVAQTQKQLTTPTFQSPFANLNKTLDAQASLKSVPAKQGGFHIGDVISNPGKALQDAEKEVGNVAQSVKNFTLTYLPQTARDLQQLKIDPLGLKANPTKVLSDAWKSISPDITNYIKNYKTVGLNTPPVDKSIPQALNRVSSESKVVYSPLTAIFSAANNIPIAKTVAKLITLPLSVFGEGAPKASDKVIDSIPNKVLSPDMKEAIKKPVGELLALVIQIGLLHGVEKVFTPEKMGELTEKYGTQDAVTMRQQAINLATKQDLKPGTVDPQQVIDHVVQNDLTKTPEGKQMLQTAVEAQKQNATITLEDKNKELNQKNTQIERQNVVTGQKEEKRLTNPQQLEQAKSYEANNLPKDATENTKVTVYRSGTGELKNGDYITLNAEHGQSYQSKRAGSTFSSNEVALKDLIKSDGTGDEFIYSPKEVKTGTSKIALSIQQKALDAGITDKLELAGYDKQTIKDQLKQVQELSQDKEQFSKVLTGEQELPKGLNPVSVIKAAEEHVFNTGDSEMLQKLANSPLISETSKAAQVLRMAAEREPDSLTAKLQDLKKAKEQAIEKKYGKTVAEVIKKTPEQIKSRVKIPDKYDWSKFVDSIQC